MRTYKLLCCILNKGAADDALKALRAQGTKGGTIYSGVGSADNKWLRSFSETQSEKDVLISICGSDDVPVLFGTLEGHLSLRKPNRGVAFTIPVIGFTGSEFQKSIFDQTNVTEENNMYNAIFAVVDKGKSELAIDAAIAAGATGATIWNARGSGFEGSEEFIGLHIEPEKELVMIVVRKNITSAIMVSINEKLDIEAPGNGIVFVTPVSDVLGIR